MARPSNLVIVESPSKAKTIGKYLGPDYVVKASMGHLRDLPRSTMGVDLEHGFTPHYSPVKGKEELIRELKTAAASADTVYLATDPDRFTEASLVKAMEEKGVGRPSTYAATISTIEDREYVEKKDKHLMPTPLGEVVTGLMVERFQDIIDVEFTANMESRLDQVEEGKQNWVNLLSDFYKDFETELKDAETALEGVRLKVPEEETDEVCELCGRKMVIKTGRFGKFLACPGFPECKFTKPLVERMPGRCPKCGSGLLKRRSKRGFAYYACEQGAQCGFMTWDVPTAEDCPVCGQTLFKRSGKGRMKPFCVNPNCSNFLPEDKRGYYKKKTDAAPGGEATPEAVETAAPQPEEAKAAKKKTTAKKAAAPKKTTAAKKTASPKRAATRKSKET